MTENERTGAEERGLASAYAPDAFPHTDLSLTVKARSLKHSNLNGLLVSVMGEIKCDKTSYIQMYCSSHPENIFRGNGEVQQDK